MSENVEGVEHGRLWESRAMLPNFDVNFRGQIMVWKFWKKLWFIFVILATFSNFLRFLVWKFDSEMSENMEGV